MPDLSGNEEDITPKLPTEHDTKWPNESIYLFLFLRNLLKWQFGNDGVITFFVSDSIIATVDRLYYVCFLWKYIYKVIWPIHIPPGSICTLFNHSIYHILNLFILFIGPSKKYLILTQVEAEYF